MIKKIIDTNIREIQPNTVIIYKDNITDIGYL